MYPEFSLFDVLSKMPVFIVDVFVLGLILGKVMIERTLIVFENTAMHRPCCSSYLLVYSKIFMVQM